MNYQRTNFIFINIGHFFAHFFLLIFATVAALALSSDWGISYAELIPYATPGFVAFGLGSYPAGWLADKWNRRGMMTIFFIGIGASSMAASLVQTPLQMSLVLVAVGLFSAIYHPVGLAMLVEGRAKTG
ncbi:MAG: MFS transporter, partial [Rhodospirillales bacterium]|nr:MFS transporter [Rhodospirillales bacterium]